MNNSGQGLVNQFETGLTTASEEITETWECIDALQQADDDLSETYIDALTQAENELEHLEQVDTVTQKTLDNVISLSTRVTAIESILETLLRFYTLKLERRVGQYRCWFDHLSELLETADIQDDTLRSQCNELQKQFKLAEKSFNDSRHIKLLSHEKFSISGLDTTIRSVDDDLQTALASATYIEYCKTVMDAMNERIINNLQSLSEANPQRTNYSSSLREYRSTVTTLADETSDAMDDADIENAGTALAGFLDIANETADDRAAQQTAQEFVSVIDSLDRELADIDSNVLSQRADEGQLDAVRSRIAAVLQGDITITDEQRFTRLLRKYDRSLDAVITHGDFSVDEAFDILQSQYVGGAITDTAVEFES